MTGSRCEAMLLSNVGRNVCRCDATADATIEGHALCWTHRRAVLDGLATVEEVIAGRRHFDGACAVARRNASGQWET